MQQEPKIALRNKQQLKQEIITFLGRFLQQTSPDLQYRLAHYPPEVYFEVILDTSLKKQIRQACCASFKTQISDVVHFRPLSNTTISRIQSIYFDTDPKVLTDIEGSLAALTEKLFEFHLDDQKKLKAFTDIIDKIAKNSSFSSMKSNLRGINLANFLLNSMQASTINNQISIGQLVCYYKQIYYPKNQTSDPLNISGQGLNILQNASSSIYLDQSIDNFLQVQIEIAKLINIIIEKLALDEIQQGDSIPGTYIRNSRQIQSLFESILCASHDNRIYSFNKRVNELKAIIISIYLEHYPYHVQEPLFLLCVNSIVMCNRQIVIDDVQTIIAAILQLLQRSTNHIPYITYFYSNTQILVLKLLELASVRGAQIDSIEKDPQQFAYVSDDFSKNQESESVKARAGSLLYNLCLVIDGNLTFVVNLIFVPLYALEKQLLEKIRPNVQIRQVAAQGAKGLPVLLDLWNGTPQGLTEVSLLVISCISDLITKRTELHQALQNHLTIIQNLFKQKEKIAECLPPIIIARYIQVISFFSYPECMDRLLVYYNLHPVLAETILKALQTIIQYHDKKSEAMRNYVAFLSTKVLLISDKLTPLLQKIILQKPQLVLCIKQKLIEKLVIWLLKYLENENMHGCNKISNLLCKTIQQYPKFIIKDDSGYNYQLQALNQYTAPLYKFIISHKQHPAEDCVIDIAVQQLQSVGFDITAQNLRDFVHLGVSVVQQNGNILNKCLQLFSRVLSIPCPGQQKQKPQIVKLRNIQIEAANFLLPKVLLWIQNVSQRDADRWELLFLLEIVLLTVNSVAQVQNIINFTKLKQIYQTSTNVVRLKVQIIWMLLLSFIGNDQNQIGKCFLSTPIPERIPPFQKNNFTIYLIRVLSSIRSIPFQIYLIRTIISLFNPSEKLRKYLTSYQEVIHCSGKIADAQIHAFQATKTVLHPFSAYGIDGYSQFRSIFGQVTSWPEILKILNKQQQQAIRDILAKQIVGTRVRKIVHVKKL